MSPDQGKSVGGYEYSDANLMKALEDAIKRYSSVATGEKDVGKKRKAKAMPEEKEKMKYKSVDFEQAGKKMILPKGMGYEEAIHHLKKKQVEEETEINIFEEIDAFPFDGAFMLMKVLQDRYGWASPVPIPGFFGPKPPTMVGLEIAPGEFTQIIWGAFSMPGIEGRLQTQMSQKNGKLMLVISGTVKKKNEGDVKEIAAEVRKRIREESVYKGQAIRLTTNDDGAVTADTHPTFIDVTQVREEELILPEAVREEVETSVFTPIEQTSLCRKLKIPLKRGVLLEGPYGTGKTLTAYVTAKKCVENRWTFIYLDRPSGLKSALQFARQYMPAVIFSEDIDRIVEGEERTTDIDDVLNTIDGIESKGTEIMTVLTTNHVDKINKAMLRPGRLDAVISIQPPDRDAAAKLIKIYARGLVAANADLVEASNELAGQIPAVIREVVERAKMRAIFRMKGATREFGLEDSDLASAARSMKHHLKLMSTALPEESVETQFGSTFRRFMVHSVNPMIAGRELIDSDEDKIGRIK